MRRRRPTTRCRTSLCSTNVRFSGSLQARTRHGLRLFRKSAPESDVANAPFTQLESLMNVRRAVTTTASVLLGAMLATSAAPDAASATQGAGGCKEVLAPDRPSLSITVG